MKDESSPAPAPFCLAALLCLLLGFMAQPSRNPRPGLSNARETTYTYFTGSSLWSPPYFELRPLNEHRRDHLELAPDLESADVSFRITQSAEFFEQFHKTVEVPLRNPCDMSDPTCSEEYRARSFSALTAGQHTFRTRLKRGDFIQIDTYEGIPEQTVEVRVITPLGLITVLSTFSMRLDSSRLTIPATLRPAANPPPPVMHYAYVRDSNCLRNPNCQFALNALPQSSGLPWYAEVLGGIWDAIGPAKAYAEPPRCREPTIVVFGLPGGGVQSGQMGDIRAQASLLQNNPALRDYNVMFIPLLYSGDTRISEAAADLRTHIADFMSEFPPESKFIMIGNCQGAVVGWKILRDALQGGASSFPVEQYSKFISFELPFAGGWAPNVRPLQQLWWWFDFLDLTYAVNPQAEDMYYQSPLLRAIEAHEIENETRIFRTDSRGNYIYHKERGDRIGPPGFQTYDHTPWERPNYEPNRAIMAHLKEVLTNAVIAAAGANHCPDPTPRPYATVVSSGEPTPDPTATATITPTITPSRTPTRTPTATPQAQSTIEPTPTATQTPTPEATSTPTPTPTPEVTPTPDPTATVSPTPTRDPNTPPGGGCNPHGDEYQHC